MEKNILSLLDTYLNIISTIDSERSDVIERYKVKSLEKVVIDLIKNSIDENAKIKKDVQKICKKNMEQINELQNLVEDYQDDPNELERFETPLNDTRSFMKKIIKKNKLSLKIHD